MIDFAMKFTEAKLPEVRKEAQQRVDTLLGSEIERLKQLQKKNKTITTWMIEQFWIKCARSNGETT